MSKTTNHGRRALAVVAVLAVVGVVGLAHATLGLYTTAGAQYVGHWVWNDDETNSATVDVRLKAQPPKQPKEQKAAPPAKVCIQNFKVEVEALAEDGTSVKNFALVQIQLGFTREVTVSFDRKLTSLTFIRILSLPGGGNCAALP